MVVFHNRTHNNQDWTSHKKEVIRPSERIAVEIFSFDHQYTQTYNRNQLSGGFNYKKVSHRHLNCMEAADQATTFAVELDYEAKEIGEYRIDVLYENKEAKDYVGRYDIALNQKSATYINTKPVQYKAVKNTKKGAKQNDKVKKKIPQISTAHRIKGTDLNFDGEPNITKRNTIFTEIQEMGKYHISIELPYNCYFIGAIVRKIVKFTGDNVDSAETNISLKDCELSFSGQATAAEASFTIGYNHEFENPLSQSGFYMDYRDEVNIYVKETGDVSDTLMVQRFGGYISTIKDNNDNTALSISCADRLIDGQNDYCLDAVFIAGTTSQEIEYFNPITVDSYGQGLKYFVDIFENTLNSNIKKNYTVDGEKYTTKLTVRFGKKKDIKKLTVTNAKASPQNNFIIVRNNPKADKEQRIGLYDAKKAGAKKPIDITKHLTFHMVYGLGDPVRNSQQGGTVSGEGAQSFTKCGVSKDGKYLMAIGIGSAGKDSVSGWTKTIFKRKCPQCGYTDLVWDIDYGQGGYAPCRGANEGGGNEGHIFCRGCDADYSCQGWEHIDGSNWRIEPVSPVMPSSKAEKDKLRAGQMTAVPTTGAAMSADDVLKHVADLMKDYRYDLDTGASTYEDMKKSGVGECWAFSDGIFTELKKLGVACRICDYVTSQSPHHRSVVYKNAKGEWEDFPYKKYGFHSWLSPTSARNVNNYVANYNGKTIVEATGVASGDSSGTVTTSTGYDRDKPIQCYVEIVYSTIQKWTAKKSKINLDFTLKAGTDSDWTGLSNTWINNAMRQTSVSMQGFFDDNEPNNKIYLHSVSLVAPKQEKTSNNDKAEWYTYDKSTKDEASCKMDLYQITFDDRLPINPTDLQSCGKSILSLIGELVASSGYRCNMTYNTHRKDDKINFSVNNQTEAAFVATEGDNNNILNWSNISYSPVSELRNKSICVFKNSSGKYEYVDTGQLESMLKYGLQTSIVTESEQISAKQAYFEARNNKAYNPEQEYSYTIVVPFAPNLKLGDLVQVISNSRKLNDVKTVESIKIRYKNTQIPKIQTELGLNELEPFLRIKKEQEALRNLTRKKTTVFSATATPVEDEDIYIWDN